MILDLNDLPDAVALQTDLCIIGSGAAGLAMAIQFASTPHSVVVLEGGGAILEPESQALYDSEVVGHPHNGVHRGRARVFGGTTTLWAGQALPLDSIDFRERCWVPDSGWPVDRAYLDPYYRRAETLLGLPFQDYMRPIWTKKTQSKLQFDDQKFRTLTSQFSPQPNFSYAYRDVLNASRNVTVLLHANATSLVTSESGSRVDRVEVASLLGRRTHVRSKFFVICCGGIESARLLLNSNDVQKHGLGNQHDLVGRYFQDHVQACTLPIQSTWPKLRLLSDAVYVDGIARCPKVAASEQFQESESILNATVGVVFDGFADHHGPVEAAKRIFKGVSNRRLSSDMWQDLLLALTAPGQLAAAGFRRFAKRQPAFRMTGKPHIGLQCECAPLANSRVTLSNDKDGLGVRRVRLDWRLAPLVTRTVEKIVRAFADEMNRLGIGHCDVDGIESKSAEEWNLFDANHHIGTTRMSVSPRKGVVDPDCKIFSIDNVYIASSSVFPTGGHSNPTLTILALVMRISDHLRTKLG